MAVETQSPTGTTRQTPIVDRRVLVADRRVLVPSWWRDAVGLTIWANLLIVTALWVSGGGLQALSTPAGAFTTLGRLTGLIASVLLLIQVLLMARLPVVERVYGQDELARRHRLVGFWSFSLMLVHLVLITIGYALSARLNVFVQFWELVVDYPGMLLATAGTVLVVVVAMSSIRAARRKLRYESWHLIHLYAYLGVGLALPHQLWTGQEFLSNAWATIYWWGLWIAALVAIVGWRLAVPLYRSLRHDLRVAGVRRESADVISVLISGRDLDRLPVAAGQFFHWRFLGRPSWTRAHPYSLSAAPNGRDLRITVKDLGDGSHELAGVTPGSRVLIEGPYGRLHGGVRTSRKVLLMGAGIGITPLRALLEELPQAPGDVTFIYRAGSDDELVLAGEIEQLAASRGARVFFVVGHRRRERNSWLPSSAGTLSDADGLRRLVPDIAEHDVYLCGADAWMDAAAKAARECGVPADRIHSERFSW
ncbi:putative ferric reductase [Propionicimonas paludicola]|uniref:Putative ferric reductase n=1 Tax=Propionicimonas paludicola TaxID=185243 RepID=A0A2A9CWG4_9ACTN|nr:putative ferric reductase [Propionicimonas paludicola]